MSRTKLLLSVLSVAALLFVTACQPALPGVDTGDTSAGLESDPLVNVAVNANIGIEDTIVQVPASIAANVCGVDVSLLTQEAANTGSTPTCTATSSSSLEQLQPYAQEG